MFKKNRKAFSLLELIVAIAAISFLSVFIYKTYAGMQEIDRKAKMVKDMDTIKNSMKERLRNVDILEGTLISSEKVYLGDLEVYEKNKFSRLLDNDNKKQFWGTDSNQYKKYVYPQQKFYSTAYGEIPYTDFYVIMIGPKFDKIFRNNPEKLNNELFIIEENKGLVTRFYKKYYETKNGEASQGAPTGDADTFDPNGEGYPTIQASGLNQQEFKSELKNVIIFKVSTQDIVLEKYNETLKQLQSYAKNLKDWGSIQMSMYENIISKYGGSYNIGYFVSQGVNASSYKGSEDLLFDKEMLYSSMALDSSDNPIRKSDGNKQGLSSINADNIHETKYGIVICESDCEGNISSENITSLYDLGNDNLIENLPGGGNINITNAIQLDSKQLLPGSKLIFGVNENIPSVHNAFGEKYKFYFTNVKSWNLEWTSVGTDSATHQINSTQNVPTIGSYAPFSATLFTIFPWLVDEKKTTISNGYLDIKIFPELR